MLRDTAGNKVKLSSFKGKTIYLDFWSTTCGPCIKMFPYEDALLDRLKKSGLDSNILLIKICGDSPTDKWKWLIEKQNSKAINLILPGKAYKLFRRYKLPYYSTYHLIGADFKYLGSDVFEPNDPNIDYYLFRATQNISFAEAVKELQQFQNGVDVPIWFLEWKKRPRQLTQ